MSLSGYLQPVALVASRTQYYWMLPHCRAVGLPVWLPAEKHFTLQDGRVEPPAFLEEGQLALQRKWKLWPFGGSTDDTGGKFKRGME
jgi:hypothetical protein